jgi:hypothetical protein
MAHGLHRDPAAMTAPPVIRFANVSQSFGRDDGSAIVALE